ncbi:MAG: hypothetical protein ABSB50_07700 [Terracidiphilus sp.]|jgi:hypothetical protein
MRGAWLVAVALALAAETQASTAQAPVVQVDFSNPALQPPQWTLILYADGTGHFRSQMGKSPDGGWKEIEAPGVDRDVHVSKDFARQAFDVAQRHRWFNEKCESHLKVAFQGWKTLSYTGPQGQGACTFNFSRDREIQELGDAMVAVAQTIEEGARLQVLLEHDRLGLDQEMDFLTQAVADGRAQQIGTIRDILERLAQDDEVLDRVRKRARDLLTHGPT